MIIENVNGFTKITAADGCFLSDKRMKVYGVSILLGSRDKPENYRELPLSEMPKVDNIDPLTPEEEEQLKQLLKRKNHNR